MEIGKLLPGLKFLSLNIIPGKLLDLLFLSKMPKLKNLEIDCFFEDLPDHKLGFQCANLTTVKLLGVHSVDYSLINILSKMPNLRTLTLEHCEVDCWYVLLKTLEPLKLLRSLTLWITNAKEPTYSDFDDLTNLKQLKIYRCAMPPGLLATILTRCPNLMELDLLAMDHPLDDETVRVIGQKLTRLNLLTVGRHALSEASERFIRDNCGSLQGFEITEK